MLNDVALVPTSNTSALWHSDQPDRFNGAYTAWDVPASALRSGNNTIAFTCTAASDLLQPHVGWEKKGSHNFDRIRGGGDDGDGRSTSSRGNSRHGGGGGGVDGSGSSRGGVDTDVDSSGEITCTLDHWELLLPAS